MPVYPGALRVADNPSTDDSPSHVFVQKSEHVGLPVHSEMNEVMPIINRFPGGRIDLQTMRFPDLPAAGVQHLSGLSARWPPANTGARRPPPERLAV